MAQNDYVIADQNAADALSDINNALQSLASCSSGSAEPTTKYANMLWYDTANNILKMRNEANSAWINIVYVHQTDNATHILDNTYISDTSGTHVGLLGDQAQSEWTTGTGTTESLVSPAKIKAAIDTLGGPITTYGAVGSYVLAYAAVGSQYNAGSTIAGSSLRLANTMTLGYAYNQIGYSGTAVTSGTWRCMGRTDSSNGGTNNYVDSYARVTLWVRVS